MKISWLARERARGEAGEGPVGRVVRDVVIGLDERDDAVEQVRLVAGVAVREPVEVRRDHDRRLHLAGGDQVVDDPVGHALGEPVGLVAATAMADVERRIGHRAGRVIARRRVDRDGVRSDRVRRLGIGIDPVDRRALDGVRGLLREVLGAEGRVRRDVDLARRLQRSGRDAADRVEGRVARVEGAGAARLAGRSRGAVAEELVRVAARRHRRRVRPDAGGGVERHLRDGPVGLRAAVRVGDREVPDLPLRRQPPGRGRRASCRRRSRRTTLRGSAWWSRSGHRSGR